MGLIKRFKILLKYQSISVTSGVNQASNCSTLFIFYPIAFFMFYSTMSESELSLLVGKLILYAGIFIWGVAFLITILAFFKHNKFFTGLSLYLLGIYILFTLPISATTAWSGGSLKLIILQEVSIILWPVISYLVAAYSLVDKDGKIIQSDKIKKRFNYFISLPVLIVVPVALPLTYFISDYYCTYLFWSVSMLLANSLIKGWFFILYPLRHKDDGLMASDSPSTVQSQAVNALNDTLQDKHFDKDEFKED